MFWVEHELTGHELMWYAKKNLTSGSLKSNIIESHECRTSAILILEALVFQKDKIAKKVACGCKTF
jgi:hypothetical protein